MMDAARRGEIQLSHDGWYEVVLLATGDADLANQYANVYSKARLRNDEPVV